jgi:hypothetical protein
MGVRAVSQKERHELTLYQNVACFAAPEPGSQDNGLGEVNGAQKKLLGLLGAHPQHDRNGPNAEREENCKLVIHRGSYANGI